ncbi:hypothetical protein QVD17_14143 [Tagetes erecta]|uniref:TF-B3 domain-containing protein n=1 Tax=Tagetes erecta TaxID=13708 RepID=A0AAD8P3S9_TARER|nr:hypothetical protein QVD17_14143 [Tagetes erecta]
MASSSPVNFALPMNICNYCYSSSEHLINAWRSNSGYAQLCSSCYSIYEEGLFCETFHSDEDGWRDCKSCRKVFFPRVSRGKSIALQVLDTDGTEWNLLYKCWYYRKNTVFLLQGLTDFFKSKNWQAGDTVAFYRREVDKKIIIELKKTSTLTLPSSPHQIAFIFMINSRAEYFAGMNICMVSSWLLQLKSSVIVSVIETK